MSSRICAVIPAYNASQTIGRVVRDALKHVPVVIVADDGSSDETSAEAGKAGAQIIRINQNRGKGNALKTLFQSAIEQDYDAVVSLDADGQHDPDEIPLFLEAHREHPDDIIVGSRMSEKNSIPRARLNSMRIANFYSSLASNQYLEDTQSGFRLYPLALINRMTLTTEKYATETEILIKTGDLGGRISFIRIKTIYNKNGSHFRPINDFASITSYVICYLTIKWLIEGVSPDRPNTYTRNNIIDRIGQNENLYTLFQLITVFTALPITVLFLLEYIFLLPLMNNFASVRKLGFSYFRIAAATFMLPFIMISMIIDKSSSLFGLRFGFIDKLINRLYPALRAD